MKLLRFAKYIETKYFLEPQKTKSAFERMQKMASIVEKKYDLLSLANNATRTFDYWLGSKPTVTSVTFPHAHGVHTFFCPFIMSENINLPPEKDSKFKIELATKVKKIINEFKLEINAALEERLVKLNKATKEKILIFMSDRKAFLKELGVLLDDNFFQEIDSSKSLLELIKCIRRNMNNVFKLFDPPAGNAGSAKKYNLPRKMKHILNEVLDIFAEKIAFEFSNYADELDLKSEDEHRARKIEEDCIKITDNFLSKFNFEGTKQDENIKKLFDEFYQELKKSNSMCVSIPYAMSFLHTIASKFPRKILESEEFDALFKQYRDDMERAVIGKANKTHYNRDNDPAIYRGVITTSDSDFIDFRERSQPSSIGIGGENRKRENDKIYFGNSYNRNNVSSNSREERSDNKEDALPDLVKEEEIKRYLPIVPDIVEDKVAFIGRMLAVGERYKRMTLDNFYQEFILTIAKSLDPYTDHYNLTQQNKSRASKVFRDGSRANEIYKPGENGSFVLDNKEYPGINDIIKDLMAQNGMSFNLRYSEDEWKTIVPRAIRIMKENYSAIVNSVGMKGQMNLREDIRYSDQARTQEKLQGLENEAEIEMQGDEKDI